MVRDIAVEDEVMIYAEDYAGFNSTIYRSC